MKASKKLATKINRWFEQDMNARKNYDWQWFTYDLFINGDHYAKYDKETKQIVGGQTTLDGRPKVTINKTYTTLRAVRNYVLRNKPKPQVTPENLSPDTLEQSVLLTKWLTYKHERDRLSMKTKGTLWNALKYSVGWWQVLWNGEDIEVNEIDTYDFYPDSKARGPEEMRRAFIAVKRRISDLYDDDKYDKKVLDEVTPDNKESASTVKSRLIAHQRGTSANNGNTSKEDGTVIVKECWWKEKGKIYVCALAGDKFIRKPEEVAVRQLPFFRLRSDVEPLQMYSQGWVKNLIDPNKMVDSAVSSIVEYNMIMNKGKYIADKGAGVRILNNQHGQIIEKKRGYNVSHQPVAPLSNAIFSQIDYGNRFLEDICAMHDATSGRVPTGAKSGVAIEALQVGDSNNMSELVDNLEEFLEDVYEYILWLGSQHYQDYKNIIPIDYTGERQFMKVIGANSVVAQEMGDNIPDDVGVIPEKNIVDVSITSFLAFTPEAKKESVKELMSIMPDLPEDVVLDAFGVGNIAEVIQKIREKKESDRQAELQAQRDQSEIESPSSDGGEAAAALRTLINGGMPQVPARLSPGYAQFIDQFLQSEEAQGLDPEILQAIQTFRDQVVQGVGR